MLKSGMSIVKQEVFVIVGDETQETIEGTLRNGVDCSGFTFSEVSGKPNMVEKGGKVAGTVSAIVDWNGELQGVLECNELLLGKCLTEGTNGKDCPVKRIKRVMEKIC
jgi:hypothetical protein